MNHSCMDHSGLSHVLATGHRGFVGAALCGALDRREIAWTGASRASGFDLESAGALDGAEAADVVIHLAGKADVEASWADPGAFYRTNFLTTLTALEFARHHSARFIFVSSYMYGSPHYMPIDEEHPVACNNPYSASKRQAELLCESYARDFGLDVDILRPFNLYGPGQAEESLVPTVVRQALGADEVAVNNLHPKRDYLFISDLAEAISRLLAQPGEGRRIFNIGTGTSHSVREIIDCIFRITGRDKPVHSRNARRPAEIDDCVADAGKFRGLFGWSPSHTLEQGLARTISEMG